MSGVLCNDCQFLRLAARLHLQAEGANGLGLFRRSISEYIKNLGWNHCNLIILASVRMLRHFDTESKECEQHKCIVPTYVRLMITAAFSFVSTILLLLLKFLLWLQFLIIIISASYSSLLLRLFCVRCSLHVIHFYDTPRYEHTHSPFPWCGAFVRIELLSVVT